MDDSGTVNLAPAAAGWEMWKIHPMTDGSVIFESKEFAKCYLAGKPESGPDANSEKVVLDCDQGDRADFASSKKWFIIQNDDGSYSFQKSDTIDE